MLHEVLKEKFIEGGPLFMSIILACLVIGLSIAIERILYLYFSTINNKVLFKKVVDTFEREGEEQAKEICRDTPGPVASLFLHGLERANLGVDVAEQSIISYSSIITSKLEKGLSWISFFITAAPMLGFLGTVLGMVQAFDDIEQAGDISPTIVAGGIKVALLTTVLGLIVALILQMFYNYISSRIENLVHDMEESSVLFVDFLIKKR